MPYAIYFIIMVSVEIEVVRVKILVTYFRLLPSFQVIIKNGFVSLVRILLLEFSFLTFIRINPLEDVCEGIPDFK